ncbi:MAG: YeeE/YedE family protein, partial [Devosia sp.]
MEHFSPVSASIGGALIGLSAALLWLGNGRIAGISGIFGQLLPPARTVVWRLV